MWTALLLVVSLSQEAQEPSKRHVRTTEPEVQALLDKATERSATFRSLVTTLDESDVIVYLEPQTRREWHGGYLVHQVVTSGHHRYLRILIGTQGSEERLIEVIAHELQHAVEVARAPEVRNAKGIQNLFRRIGLDPSCSAAVTCYETREALKIQEVVSKELIASRVMRPKP